MFEETVTADIDAIEEELQQLRSEPKKAEPRRVPRRQSLPPELPRIDIYHEPQEPNCTCGCQLQRIGEDISEKLDYVPGVARVERHIRGKWACRQCETLIRAPVPAHVIDKGLVITGLLAQVLVTKYAYHMPLYRQQKSLNVRVSTLHTGRVDGRHGVLVGHLPLLYSLIERVEGPRRYALCSAASLLHCSQFPVEWLRSTVFLNNVN